MTTNMINLGGRVVGSRQEYYLGSTDYILNRKTIQTVATSDTEISAYGVSVLYGVGARSYNLEAPRAGVEKTIVTLSSTSAVDIDTGGPYFAQSTLGANAHIATFTTQAEASVLNLIGLTTAMWLVKSVVGTITLSS